MKLYRLEPAAFPWTPVKIAVVTGLSDVRHCELAEDQRLLLESIDVPSEWKVMRNFPFVAARVGTRRSSLLRASLANGYQFLNARRLMTSAAPHWRALFASTDRLLLLVGSCGYQFVADALRFNPGGTAVQVLSLGPVGFRRARRMDSCVVQGEGDWISRLFVATADVRLRGVGHMDYWGHEQVREVVRDWVRRKTSESSASAAIFRSLA